MVQQLLSDLTMALSNSLIAVILVSLLFIGYVQSESTLSPFGKKVKSLIPKDVYNLMFNSKGKDNDQFVKALKLTFDNIQSIYGAKVDKSLQKQLIDVSQRVGFDQYVGSFLFTVNTNTAADVLKENGKLNSNNVADAAQKFVNDLKKTAMALKTDNVEKVLPALGGTVVTFLRSYGLTSKAALNEFVKNFVAEMKNYYNLS